MSSSLTPIITKAGLEAVVNASHNGLQATITQVALGDAAYEPDNLAITLKSERNRIAISQARRLKPNQIHFTAIENGDKAYWVREIGFILDDGTLLAIWSHPTQALAFKASNVDLLLALDLVVSALPADSINVDGTGQLDLAPANETKLGTVRLATLEEAEQGRTSGAVVMTPAGSQAHGDLRYAAKTHRHRWEEIYDKPQTYPSTPHHHDERYALQSGNYPELRAQATTKEDVGLSNVPNYPITNHVTDSSAEKFATAAAVNYAYNIAINHQHDWQEIDGKPQVFPSAPHDHDERYAPITHQHAWLEINGKPQVYPSAPHTHDERYAQTVHQHHWNDIDAKPATYPSEPHHHDERYALQNGIYPSLRAQATTKEDVGLANVPNYPITNSISDNSNNKFASASAVKLAYDTAKARTLSWGEVQISGYLTYTPRNIQVGNSTVRSIAMDYRVPNGCVMIGFYSDYVMLTVTEVRWRVHYRSLQLL